MILSTASSWVMSFTPSGSGSYPATKCPLEVRRTRRDSATVRSSGANGPSWYGWSSAPAYPRASWALWKDPESREAWQKSRVFEEDLTALRALCEDFHGGNHEIAVLIGEGDVEADA